MNGDILKEIAEAAKFEMKIFDGALMIEGRILSPAEVEAAGLASALLASQAIKGKSQEQLKAIQEAAERAQDGETGDIEMLLQLANTINPRMLEAMRVKEAQLIIKCV